MFIYIRSVVKKEIDIRLTIRLYVIIKTCYYFKLRKVL